MRIKLISPVIEFITHCDSKFLTEYRFVKSLLALFLMLLDGARWNNICSFYFLVLSHLNVSLVVASSDPTSSILANISEACVNAICDAARAVGFRRLSRLSCLLG